MEPFRVLLINRWHFDLRFYIAKLRASCGNVTQFITTNIKIGWTLKFFRAAEAGNYTEAHCPLFVYI